MRQHELFKSYITAWLHKDLSAFLALLSADISCTECFGASYQGKAECERWFSNWFKSSENKVLSWKVHQSFFDEKQQTAFYTWTFECLYDDKISKFDGSSLVKFKDHQILEIQEFEQKFEKFFPCR